MYKPSKSAAEAERFLRSVKPTGDELFDVAVAIFALNLATRQDHASSPKDDDVIDAEFVVRESSYPEGAKEAPTIMATPPATPPTPPAPSVPSPALTGAAWDEARVKKLEDRLGNLDAYLASGGVLQNFLDQLNTALGVAQNLAQGATDVAVFAQQDATAAQTSATEARSEADKANAALDTSNAEIAAQLKAMLEYVDRVDELVRAAFNPNHGLDHQAVVDYLAAAKQAAVSALNPGAPAPAPIAPSAPVQPAPRLTALAPAQTLTPLPLHVPATPPAPAPSPAPAATGGIRKRWG